MKFDYTDRITAAEKFNPENIPAKTGEWNDELAFSAAVWLGI